MLRRFLKCLNIFKSKKISKPEVESVLTILVILKIRPEFRQKAFDSLKYDDDGIKLAKMRKGCISTEGRLSTDDKETIVILGKWATSQDFEDYMQMRMDIGYWDKVGYMFASPPVFIHLSKDSF